MAQGGTSCFSWRGVREEKRGEEGRRSGGQGGWLLARVTPSDDVSERACGARPAAAEHTRLLHSMAPFFQGRDERFHQRSFATPLSLPWPEPPSFPSLPSPPPGRAPFPDCFPWCCSSCLMWWEQAGWRRGAVWRGPPPYSHLNTPVLQQDKYSLVPAGWREMAGAKGRFGGGGIWGWASAPGEEGVKASGKTFTHS